VLRCYVRKAGAKPRDFGISGGSDEPIKLPSLILKARDRFFVALFSYSGIVPITSHIVAGGSM
jgi:hypothetical protein